MCEYAPAYPDCHSVSVYRSSSGREQLMSTVSMKTIGPRVLEKTHKREDQQQLQGQGPLTVSEINVNQKGVTFSLQNDVYSTSIDSGKLEPFYSREKHAHMWYSSAGAIQAV